MYERCDAFDRCFEDTLRKKDDIPSEVDCEGNTLVLLWNSDDKMCEWGCADPLGGPVDDGGDGGDAALPECAA